MTRRIPTPPEFRIPLRELVAMKREMARTDARWRVPPCLERDAETPEQAGTMCRASGDKDDCHGCQIWPDN